MKEYTLANDHGMDLRFTSERLAVVGTSSDLASSNYSGTTGRWTTLKLFKTTGGKFVGQIIQHTQHQGERDSFGALVCDDLYAAFAFLGRNPLAKNLYEEAGLECVSLID